jgi:hypothetical protein
MQLHKGVGKLEEMERNLHGTPQARSIPIKEDLLYSGHWAAPHRPTPPGLTWLGQAFCTACWDHCTPYDMHAYERHARKDA